jgi:hypothetical protein
LLVTLIIVGGFFVDEHSERIKFVTVNALSLLVLVIIAVQAYIYKRQWDAMLELKNLSQRQADTFDKQVDKMQGQVDAIGKQSDTMQGQLDAMKHSQRALIVLDGFHLQGIEEIASGESNEQITIGYKIINQGNTLAWIEEVTFKLWINPDDKFSLPNYESLISQPPKFTRNLPTLVLPTLPIVSQQFAITIYSDRQLTREEAEAILTPCERPEESEPKCAKDLFVLGHIKYKDAFGDSHVSRFAYLYHNSTKGILHRPAGTSEHWKYD